MMKTRQFSVSALTLAVQGALAAMLAVPALAMADDEPTVAELTRPTNTVEAGVGDVSKSSAKFGEYNGLEKSGGYAIGNFKVRGGDAYDSFDGGSGTTRWEANGSDLGTTSRELSGSVSNQGQWSIGVGYNQLRHHQITDTYQTPLQGSNGGNNFTLPNSFGGIDVSNAGGPVLNAAQQASFQTQKVYTDRKNSSFNAGYIFDRQWSAQFEYNRLEQSGAKLVGIGSDNGLAANPTMSGQNTLTLMNPTNYKTDTYDLSLNWMGDAGHLTANYHASLFKDGYDSVSFASPYYNTMSVGQTTWPVPTNVYATPPSNEFHQLNLTGGYDFSRVTKLAGGLSYARNTQTASFINDPQYETNPAAGGGPLPSSSLNGLVVTTHADLKLTHQATRDLALSAGLKYDQRDNRTPANVYPLVYSIMGDPWGTNVNVPLSNKKTLWELAGTYRIDKAQTLRLAYEHEQIKRWADNFNGVPAANPFMSTGLNPGGASGNVNLYYPTYYNNPAAAQVGASNDNKLSANYKLKATEAVTFNAGYAYARRRSDVNASYYNPMQIKDEGVQNFGFVGYFDASRREQLLKAGVTWQATEKLGLGANGRYVDDNYDATLGVQKAHTWGLNLDATYAYSEQGTLAAYVSAQRRQRDLTSSADKNPTSPVSPDSIWTNRLDDDSNTLGLALKQKGLMGGKLEMNGDLSFSLGKTTYATDDARCSASNFGGLLGNFPNGTALNANPGGVFVANLPATDCGQGGALPTIRNAMTRLKIDGVYQLDKASKIRVAYLHQKLKSDDYYYDAYQYGGTIVAGSIQTILPTGQQAPNYTVNVLRVSYLYSFQ